ncbi:PP0621 family protein [Roseateles aquatilis]|uniref:PP0621 family protein n=1 Tax=Roseateles aquatilis TaxID=431061 RepID=UPI001EDE0793|nr:PP0621 family protein [Roseateles aquatilis]
MIKLLFWIVLLAVIAFVLGFKRGRPAPREAQRPPPPPQRGLEPMVSCTECGAHLPASEALPGRGGQFCTAAHRASHEARLEAAEAARASVGRDDAGRS